MFFYISGVQYHAPKVQQVKQFNNKGPGYSQKKKAADEGK